MNLLTAFLDPAQRAVEQPALDWPRLPEHEQAGLPRMHRKLLTEQQTAQELCTLLIDKLDALEDGVKDFSLARFAAKRITAANADEMLFQLGCLYKIAGCNRDFLADLKNAIMKPKQTNLDSFIRAYRHVLKEDTDVKLD